MPRSTVRGLDFVDVSHVFIAGPPATHGEYVHLAGRTARRGMAGLCVTFSAASQARRLRGVCAKAVPGMVLVDAARVAPRLAPPPLPPQPQRQ